MDEKTPYIAPVRYTCLPSIAHTMTQLWKSLQPNTPLESRITKQWQDIGFQGNNPATDFRGMGILSLHCMLYPTY